MKKPFANRLSYPIAINGTKISGHKELSLNLLTQADKFWLIDTNSS
jgi:hypothetical protein